MPGDNQGSQRYELGRAALGDATKASVKNRMTIHSGALPYIDPGASLWWEFLPYARGISYRKLVGYPTVSSWDILPQRTVRKLPTVLTVGYTTNTCHRIISSHDRFLAYGDYETSYQCSSCTHTCWVHLSHNNKITLIF